MASTRSSLASAPVLAEVTRNGFVESVHHGIAAATAPAGEVLFQAGEVREPILPRSSLKPLQAVAMLRAGARLSGPALALACASHSGEDVHQATARQILSSVGLEPAALQNTPDRPYDADLRARWLAAGQEPTALAQNCSGKHAGMLAACVAQGWEVATYRDPEHPLQRLIVQTVQELTGEEVHAQTVDGCGAPALAVSTLGLARAFGRIAAASPDTPEGQVAAAMRAHPEMVGGTGRDVTALMRAVPGLIAKDGAEAVYAVGLADGRGVAVKITDGRDRARVVITTALLRRLGVGENVKDVGEGVGRGVGEDTIARELDALDRAGEAIVRGHGQPVGHVRAVLEQGL